MRMLYNTELGHISNRTDSLTQSIRLLNAIAIKLKTQRMAAGALNLASPEVKINLGSAESSDPIDVEQKELRETNSLVEEFMLLANVSVAKKIDEVFPQTAVLRYVASFRFIGIGDEVSTVVFDKTPFTPAKDEFREASGRALETEGVQARCLEFRGTCGLVG